MCALFGLFDFHDFPALVVTALRTGAMRQLPLVAVGTLGKRSRRQIVMSTASRRARLGVPPFWIWHCINLPGAWLAATTHDPNSSLQLLADIFQYAPARVSHGGGAVATFHVQVAPTVRAQTFAPGTANLFHRQGQQDLLLQHLLQQQTFTLILTNFPFRPPARSIRLTPLPPHP